MYDLIIVGGGPAGLAAGVLALRRRLDFLLVTERCVLPEAYQMQLEGMDGHDMVAGEELMERFRRQLEYLEFVRHYGRAVRVEAQEDGFGVVTAEGTEFSGRVLLVATGASPVRLGVKGEEELLGKGLAYSASTHAGLFLGLDVGVVGSGRRAQDAVLKLARFAQQVHWLIPDGIGEEQARAPLSRLENVQVWERVQVDEVVGPEYVSKIRLSGAGAVPAEVGLKGLFVCLGRKPNSDLVRDLVRRNAAGEIEVDRWGATSRPGLFAAGDVTHVTEHVLVHIGEGAKAAIAAYDYLLQSGT
jgi:alkyl hydroperoxide reductase subunit F